MTPNKFREMKAGDVPGLFYVRPRTRENAMTLEELQRLGINPQSVTESLGKSTKGWVCDDSDRVVALFHSQSRDGEFPAIAVLPEYEGKGVGGRLMALAEEWLAASGCKRAWLTTDLDTTLRAYGFYRKRAGPTGRSKEAYGGWSSASPMTANKSFETDRDTPWPRRARNGLCARRFEWQRARPLNSIVSLQCQNCRFR